jgi:hypothetical protein
LQVTTAGWIAAEQRQKPGWLAGWLRFLAKKEEEEALDSRYRHTQCSPCYAATECERKR